MCVRHILRHRPSALLVFKGSVPQEVSYWLRVNELELVSVSVGRWREGRPANTSMSTAMETRVCVLALTHGMGEEACAACGFTDKEMREKEAGFRHCFPCDLTRSLHAVARTPVTQV